MKYRVIILVFLLCMAAVPAMTASGDYLGGDILLGGSGVTVTRTTAAATPQATATVPTATLPLTGSVSITTTPAGATVFIDGVQKGISPLTIPDITQGGHTLKVMMNGYVDIMAPVAITAGETQPYTVTLVPVDTPLPAHPTATKSPGFETVAGLAALGAVLGIRKRTR
jgi:hypothetical protein